MGVSCDSTGRPVWREPEGLMGRMAGEEARGTPGGQTCRALTLSETTVTKAFEQRLAS